MSPSSTLPECLPFGYDVATPRGPGRMHGSIRCAAKCRSSLFCHVPVLCFIRPIVLRMRGDRSSRSSTRVPGLIQTVQPVGSAPLRSIRVLFVQASRCCVAGSSLSMALELTSRSTLRHPFSCLPLVRHSCHQKPQMMMLGRFGPVPRTRHSTKVWDNR